MPLNDLMTASAREQLNRHGATELRSPDEVDSALSAAGITLLAFNSMCGCSSGRMRPAVAQALRHEPRPDRFVTVFAGQDHEATARARQHLAGYPPSSPSIFLLKDGVVVFAMERRDIEGRSPDAVAADLAAAFDRFCAE